jgi:hypothetical protein
MPLASDPTPKALTEAFQRGELPIEQPATGDYHAVRLPNGVTVYVTDKPEKEQDDAADK